MEMMGPYSRRERATPFPIRSLFVDFRGVALGAQDDRGSVKCVRRVLLMNFDLCDTHTRHLMASLFPP